MYIYVEVINDVKKKKDPTHTHKITNDHEKNSLRTTRRKLKMLWIMLWIMLLIMWLCIIVSAYILHVYLCRSNK